MAKDPGFIFYPGDYLRDTQTLSEKAQVAYDRIICEHMRNICISKSQLNFFTKRLNEEEIAELMFVLNEVEGGYQIEWVAESINKRKAYSDSRRKNREGKSEEHMNNICKTYVKHMENENENEIENKIKGVVRGKFTKPTLDEIKAYCKERKNSVNPVQWLSYYESNGWMVGKNKMKDWKAAVRTWENNEFSKKETVIDRSKTEGVNDDYYKPLPKGSDMPETLKKKFRIT
jgi:hypothetical protein